MLEDISQKNVGLNPEAIKTFPRKISGKLYFYVSFSGIVHSIIVSNVDVIYAADVLKIFFLFNEKSLLARHFL